MSIGPPVSISISFQHDLQNMLTHSGVKIPLAGTSHAVFWPRLQQRFGSIRNYTANLQPLWHQQASAAATER
jgi:hypothetical protein